MHILWVLVLGPVTNSCPGSGFAFAVADGAGDEDAGPGSKFCCALWDFGEVQRASTCCVRRLGRFWSLTCTKHAVGISADAILCSHTALRRLTDVVLKPRLKMHIALMRLVSCHSLRHLCTTLPVLSVKSRVEQMSFTRQRWRDVRYPLLARTLALSRTANITRRHNSWVLSQIIGPTMFSARARQYQSPDRSLQWITAFRPKIPDSPAILPCNIVSLGSACFLTARCRAM